MNSSFAAFPRRGATLVALLTVSVVVLMIGSPAGAAIVPTVPLATSAEYAVVGGSTVTNTGPTVLNGSLGLSPGTSITGFAPGIVVPPGTTNNSNAAAAQAQADITTAYNNAAGRSISATTTADLGNLQLQGGVYAGPSHGALQLTGPLVLDGAGNRNSVFIFQTDSALTTASNSTVSLINGAQACNVFWQIGSSATLGTDSVFVGNILALTSITVNTSATVQGRALARNGAVTLDSNVFTRPSCALSAPPTTSGGGGTPTTAAGGGGTATTAPGGGSGGGTGPTLPGGGPAPTLPGGGPIPTLPGTPEGGPGVPGVTGPPRTGGVPLQSGFPMFVVLIGGLCATAVVGGSIRARRLLDR